MRTITEEQKRKMQEGARRGGASTTGDAKRRTNQGYRESRMSAGRADCVGPNREEEERRMRMLIGYCTVIIRACDGFFVRKGMPIKEYGDLPYGGYRRSN